ncbi:hypothetical protein ANN_24706 [Periplaneta americana]|uniref:Uncharacterized protein n=1 Tax=Periplaneta americana TaxID=6978 RepID=A0ABQ8RZB8_PERAM|nr:hypothetical protein ANN_24706 [Periplaneta americana]
MLQQSSETLLKLRNATCMIHKRTTKCVEGAGNLSYNVVTGSSVQRLATIAADHFIKVLESEVHEKTLIQALEMLSLWCAKFSNEVPKKIMEWLKKGPGLKTSTAAVRTAYIECMSACFHGNTLAQGIELIPQLLKTIEKAVAQPAQIPLVTEALCAACLLLKMASADIGADKKLDTLWNVVLDMDKQLFVSEKFLTLASDDALYHVMQLCERLLMDHAHRLNGKANPLHKAIIFCLTSPSSSLRLCCRPIVKKLISVLGGTQLARSLLKEFTRFLEAARIPAGDSLKENRDCPDTGTVGGGGGGEEEEVVVVGVGGGSVNEITAKVAVNSVITFCSGSNLAPEDAQLLALDSLICSHHPMIVAASPNLWLKLLKFLKQDPSEFIKLYEESIKRILIDEYIASQCLENCLQTIVCLNPDIMLPSLVTFVSKHLSNTSILLVTKDEYFTFLTPEGELYDKSVISGKDTENELNAKNMKRESKVYSYKEQLEELQLRRELEEKKRKQGKLKEPQLTPKQKEALRLQLEKESMIRAKLTELNERLQNVVSMMRAAANGSGEKLSLYFRDLLPCILKDLQSPLAAPYLCPLYIELRKCVFFNKEYKYLGDLIGHVTLRLQAPCCDLDGQWEDEELSIAVNRTITTLHKATVRPRRIAMNPDTSGSHLTAPAFCYVFPLLRSALLSTLAKTDDALVTCCLQIISEHAQMRGGGEDDQGNDLYHPNLLPRKQMFELLIEMISRTGGRIQQQAGSALLDVATSGSGTIGCARASADEVDSLLAALQNPSAVVRDAALRGLIAMVGAFPTLKEDYEQALRLIRRIWVARFDVSEENSCGRHHQWRGTLERRDLLSMPGTTGATISCVSSFIDGTGCGSDSVVCVGGFNILVADHGIELFRVDSSRTCIPGSWSECLDPGQTSHSAECTPNIMAVDIGHIRQHICLTWSQATKGNIGGGRFGLVLWIEFGVAQWPELLLLRLGPDDHGFD